MLSKQNRKPRWSLLHVILLLTLGGLMLTHYLHLTPIDHKIALFLCIIVSYGLIGLWVESNNAALQNLDDVEYRIESRDPAVYETSKTAIRTQGMSFYRHESSGKR